VLRYFGGGSDRVSGKKSAARRERSLSAGNVAGNEMLSCENRWFHNEQGF